MPGNKLADASVFTEGAGGVFAAEDVETDGIYLSGRLPFHQHVAGARGGGERDQGHGGQYLTCIEQGDHSYQNRDCAIPLHDFLLPIASLSSQREGGVLSRTNHATLL
jgi:hypothetical protein